MVSSTNVNRFMIVLKWLRYPARMSDNLPSMGRDRRLAEELRASRPRVCGASRAAGSVVVRSESLGDSKLREGEGPVQRGYEILHAHYCSVSKELAPSGAEREVLETLRLASQPVRVV